MAERAPEVVRQVSNHDVARLDTTITVIQTRDAVLTRAVKAERDVLKRHRNQMDAFAARMKFGSSVPWHPEGVMDWLIAQGWTPPDDLLLSEDDPASPLEGQESNDTTDVIRCDYCGDDLPSVKSRAHIPTTPNLQRIGFDADKVVCPECVTKARADVEIQETGQ